MSATAVYYYFGESFDEWGARRSLAPSVHTPKMERLPVGG